MTTRNPASVLPEPVGAAIRVSVPARSRGQPCGLGLGRARRGTAGRTRSPPRGGTRPSSSGSGIRKDGGGGHRPIPPCGCRGVRLARRRGAAGQRVTWQRAEPADDVAARRQRPHNASEGCPRVAGIRPGLCSRAAMMTAAPRPARKPGRGWPDDVPRVATPEETSTVPATRPVTRSSPADAPGRSCRSAAAVLRPCAVLAVSARPRRHGGHVVVHAPLHVPLRAHVRHVGDASTPHRDHVHRDHDDDGPTAHHVAPPPPPPRHGTRTAPAPAPTPRHRGRRGRGRSRPANIAPSPDFRASCSAAGYDDSGGCVGAVARRHHQRPRPDRGRARWPCRPTGGR